MTGRGPQRGDPGRRILDDFGSDSGFLAFVDVSNTDLLFLGPVLVLAMIALELVVIATGQFFPGVGLALGVLAIASAYVYVCPDHRTPIGLLWSFVSYHRRDTTMTFTDTATDDVTDPPADVRELTRVRTVEPEIDAIRRHDETLVGAVRIEPANLALADEHEWDRAARGLGDVFNALDYPVQIHSSARPVDPERMTAAYDERLTDSDVRATPALHEIVDVYRRRRPREFRERGTSIRRYHALVPVDIREVSLEEHAWIRRLRSVPLVGARLASPLADWVLHDERRAAIEERQRKILAERRSHLADQLTSVEDITVRSVSGNELVQLVEEYWTGRRAEYADDGPHLRTAPLVMSDHDADRHRSTTDSKSSVTIEADQE